MTTPPTSSNSDEPQAPPIVGSSPLSPLSPLSPEATFSQRARLILAEQRGLNARSRLKLETAAQQLGLSDEQIEAAITTIQHDSINSTFDSQADERTLAFQSFLDQRFADLDLDLLTQNVEKQLVAEGTGQFKLDANSATQLVRGSALRIGLQTVSQQQAEDHISKIVSELLDDGTSLDDGLRAQVFEEGRQWGLEPPQVDRVIRRHIRRNRKRNLTNRSMTGIALALGVGGIVTLIGFFGWLVILNGRRSRQTPTSTVNAGTSYVSPAEPWWALDEQLATTITLARIEMPALNEPIAKLDSQELEDRGRAYRELIGAVNGDPGSQQQWSTMQSLVAGCFALDPSDYCARKLADELVGLIPKPTVDDRFGVAEIDRALWAANTIGMALNHPELSETRQSMLLARLSEYIQQPVPQSVDTDSRDRITSAVCDFLIDRIVVAAADDPIRSAPLFSAVLRHADTVWDKAKQESYIVLFLSWALPAAKENWQKLDGLLTAAIQSADPLVVLKIVDLFERVENDALKEFLASRLLQRAGIFTPSIATSDVADRVREALGATDRATDRTRLAQLSSAIREGLSLPEEVDAADSITSLQQSIQLAHTSTLACAMEQGEIGHSSFDELARDEPFQLLADYGEAPPRERQTPAANSSQLERALRQLQRLTDADRLPNSRPAMLAGVAGYATYVPDLPPDSAAELAKYLLAAKSRQEHDLILEYVVPATRWYNVRLALADQVSETSLQQARCVELISRVLQTSITLAPNSDWRRELRDELIKDVVRDLSYTVRRESRHVRMFDNTRQALFDLYATQARLLGVSLQRSPAESPADVLKNLAESQLRVLGDRQQSRILRKEQQRLQLEIETIDYVAESGLDRAIQWQRIWARVLALRISLLQPALAKKVAMVIESMQSDDQSVNPQATHLRNGELALLRLWSLDAGFGELVVTIDDP